MRPGRWLAILLCGPSLAGPRPCALADGCLWLPPDSISLLQKAVRVEGRAAPGTQQLAAARLEATARHHEAVLAKHRFAAETWAERRDAEVTVLRGDGLVKRRAGALRLLCVAAARFVGPETRSQHVQLLVVASVVCLLAAVCVFSHFLLGRIVNAGVESSIKTIGTDIVIDRRSTYSMPMRVELHGFKILNPRGYGYTSPYVLCAQRVIARVAPWRLLSSFGKHVDVEELVLENISLMVEYDGYFFGGTSNLQRILEFMAGSEGKKPSTKRRASASFPPKKDSLEETLPGVGDLTVREVRLHDIDANISNRTMGFDIQVGDIRYDDFAKQEGDTFVEDFVWTILTRLQQCLLSGINPSWRDSSGAS